MKCSGFIFAPGKFQYAYARERAYIIQIRKHILLWVDKYRKERFQIFYQDKNSFEWSMAPSNLCKDSSNEIIIWFYQEIVRFLLYKILDLHTRGSYTAFF